MQNGIPLLLLAMCLTPGSDALAKQLTAQNSPFTVAFLRYLAAGLFALAVARMTGAPIQVPKSGQMGQFARTALLVASITCLISALSMVPLAYAVGGYLIAPVVSVVLSVLIYRETISAARITGVALSFAGAALIARPATGLEPGAALALLGGVLLGTYLALTRGAKDSGGALSSLAVQCLVGAALLAPIALFKGLPPLSGTLILSVAGLGALSAAAHFLTVAAYERSDAAVLSPFMYFNLLAALLVGYLGFGEVPGWLAMAGALAIALGGLLATQSTLAGPLSPILNRVPARQIRNTATNRRLLTPN